MLAIRRADRSALRHLTWPLVCSLLALAGGCGEETPGEPTDQLESAATVCAAGSTVPGLDVSYYQGTIDWARVAASGERFAIARVSDGANFDDPKFAANWRGIKAAGMIRGVYQFFRPGQDATAQANLLINAVGRLGDGDLPAVVDVEATDGQSRATIAAKLQTWVTKVQAGTGKKPIVYTGKYFWQDNVGSGAFSSYPLWHAQYTSASCPNIADQWPRWKMWQYTSSGRVAGISGNVDRNRFNGSLADLRAFAGGGGGGPDYAAEFVSQSFPYASQGAVDVRSGDTVDLFIEMKNVGAKTWNSSTLLAPTPRDDASPLADDSWISPTRIVGVTGTVAPGAKFKFRFKVRGASRTGRIDQFFGMVQEGVTWFSASGQGGPTDRQLEGLFNVTAAASPPPPPPPPADGGAEEPDAGSMTPDSPDGGVVLPDSGASVDAEPPPPPAPDGGLPPPVPPPPPSEDGGVTPLVPEPEPGAGVAGAGGDLQGGCTVAGAPRTGGQAGTAALLLLTVGLLFVRRRQD